MTLHDLVEDPLEMENIGNPAHPRYDAAAVDRMRAKLVDLIEGEIGDDVIPFNLDLFGTREVKHREGRADRMPPAAWAGRRG